MSLEKEYGCSKIGATRKKAYTTTATTTIELIAYVGARPFVPASFAVKLSTNAYMRQTGSSTPPTDMSLEFEGKTSFIWRVDVETPSERYLHLKAMTSNGSVKVTDITKVSGTSSDLDA